LIVHCPGDGEELSSDWFVELIWKPAKLPLHAVPVTVARPCGYAQHVALDRPIGLFVQPDEDAAAFVLLGETITNGVAKHL
jgi:hypothetical protein